MEKKVKISGLIIILIIFFIIMCVPFICRIGEYNYYCRYRLGVYICYPIEAEGEGSTDSDTFIGNIILKEKIGGPLEYFGLKGIKYDSIKRK